MQTLEDLKKVMIKFNLEVIERGNPSVAPSIFTDDFLNHSASAGAPSGPEGMLNTFNNILRPALKNLRVHIRDQVAEGDKVTTRKTITGIYSGALMGISPTEREVAIEVIDIVRIVDGKYADHWGMNNLASVLTRLRG